MCKGLYINRENIEPWIHERCREIFTEYKLEGPVELNPQSGQNRYTIHSSCGKIVIDFFYRKDNKTSISSLGAGKQKELATDIANYIKDKSEYKDVGVARYTMGLDAESFELMIGYLKELPGVKLERMGENPANSSCHYQFLSDIGDKITLTYFKTKGKLYFDGKVMNLYQEINYFLSAIVSSEEIIHKESKQFSIDVDHAEINNEIQQLLPTVHTVLDSQLLKILSTSLVYKKIDIKLEDYSSFVFPALKTLEGYIKHLFGENEIIIDNKLGFAYKDPNQNIRISYFIPHGGIYKLRNGQTFIACPKTCKAIEESYNYYLKERHSLFHTDATPVTTRIIENRDEAYQIIDTVINLMERTYCSII